MNTKDKWLTTVSANDSIRKVLWTRIFGRNEVPVKSIIPQNVLVHSVFEPERIISAYMLDWQALSDQQQEKVIDWISTEFKEDPAHVRKDIEENGVPVLADSCSVHTTDPGLLFSLIDDGSEIAPWRDELPEENCEPMTDKDCQDLLDSDF